MRILHNALICFSLFLFASCASIISTSKQCVNIDSSPSGATVFIDGNKIGTSPLFCLLERIKEHDIKIELVGYQPYEVHLGHETNVWSYLNLFQWFPGCILGFGIDYTTGAIYSLAPDQINATLMPTSVTSISKDDRVFVCMKLNADPNWVKIGQMKKN